MKFAYLFERFPSFTQTFCYREVTEVVRKGVDVAIYSIRPAEGKVSLPREVLKRIQYFPEQPVLRKAVEKQSLKGEVPSLAEEWLNGPEGRDNARVREAVWLGPILKEKGIGHLHAHFAGMAARTAYWIKKLYGISYSFTAHANDVFEETDQPIKTSDLIEQAAFVATETEFSRQWLEKRYPAFAGKIHRVYNGIAIDTPPPVANGRNRGGRRPRILSVGRLIEKKGHSCLVDACALLRDRGVDFECNIVGGGPLEEELRGQIERLSLSERVRLTGALPFEQVREFFKQSDIFALPCSLESKGGMDNFPTVIIEAMLHGLPVVSTRMAGVPEMMEADVTGLLLEEASASPLADALVQLIDNPECSASMGQAGYQRVVERFSVAVTTEQLLGLIGRYAPHSPPDCPRPWWKRLSSLFGG